MKTPEEKAARAAYMREWRNNNREELLKKEQARRDKNREHTRTWKKEWYAKNSERVLNQQKARREADPWQALMYAKVNSANQRYPGKLKVAEVAEVFEKANRTCHWCGKKNLTGRDLTLEHLEPINDIRYLTVSCLACNSARILERGPRKNDAEKAETARIGNKRWRQANREKLNERWWNMTDEERQARRDYMREYMRKRRDDQKKV